MEGGLLRCLVEMKCFTDLRRGITQNTYESSVSNIVEIVMLSGLCETKMKGLFVVLYDFAQVATCLCTWSYSHYCNTSSSSMAKR